MRQRSDGSGGSAEAGLLLALLLAADGVFVALHLWAADARPEYRLLSIAADNSYAELFQYLKFFWLTLLMLRLSWQARDPGFLPLGTLFLYLLLDDLLRLHEDGGAGLASAWNLPALADLRPKDLGELAVSAAAGLILLPAIGLAYRWGGVALRVLTRRLTLLLALLAIAGIGLDLLTAAWRPSGLPALLLGLLEDGGEMLIASLMLATGFAAVTQGGAPVSPDGSARLPLRAPVQGEPSA